MTRPRRPRSSRDPLHRHRLRIRTRCTHLTHRVNIPSRSGRSLHTTTRIPTPMPHRNKSDPLRTRRTHTHIRHIPVLRLQHTHPNSSHNPRGMSDNLLQEPDHTPRSHRGPRTLPRMPRTTPCIPRSTLRCSSSGSRRTRTPHTRSRGIPTTRPLRIHRRFDHTWCTRRCNPLTRSPYSIQGSAHTRTPHKRSPRRSGRAENRTPWSTAHNRGNTMRTSLPWWSDTSHFRTGRDRCPPLRSTRLRCNAHPRCRHSRHHKVPRRAPERDSRRPDHNHSWCRDSRRCIRVPHPERRGHRSLPSRR